MKQYKKRQIIEMPFSTLSENEMNKLSYIPNYGIKDIRDKIKDVLNTIPPREKKIIQERLGFYGKAMTLMEIALEEGVSRTRIRQIVFKGIRRLKKYKRISELKECWEEYNAL